jgi:hypothetical protein
VTFLRSIGEDATLAKLMGSRWVDVVKAVEGTQQFRMPLNATIQVTNNAIPLVSLTQLKVSSKSAGMVASTSTTTRGPSTSVPSAMASVTANTLPTPGLMSGSGAYVSSLVLEEQFSRFKQAMPLETPARLRGAWEEAKGNASVALLLLANPGWTPRSNSGATGLPSQATAASSVPPALTSQGKKRRKSAVPYCDVIIDLSD